MSDQASPNTTPQPLRLARRQTGRPPLAGKPEIAITGIDMWPLRQPGNGQSLVMIEVQTDSGVSGWGEAYGGQDPGTVVRHFESLRPTLIGLDATAAEAVRIRLRSVAGKMGFAVSKVQGALNMALMDLLGRLADAPACAVFGGPTREKARALAPLTGASDAELIASLRRATNMGFRAVAVPLPMPDGPARGRSFYTRTRQRMENLRASAHEEVDFVLRCQEQASPAEVLGLARELESFRLLWIELPVKHLQHQSLTPITSETVTPVGIGSDVEEIAEFQDLLRLDAVDILRPDISRWGMTQIRKAAALAETYFVAVAPAHRGGPLATAAALQLAAAVPNFFIQEVPLSIDERDAAMRRELAGAKIEKVTDGFFAIPHRPGLAITPNRDALERYRVRPS